MSQKEAPRIGLLKALVARRVMGPEVAAALDVTVRQVWRLKRRVESAGAEGLFHRGRGRPSPRRQALGRPAKHRRRPRQSWARRAPDAGASLAHGLLASQSRALPDLHG
jgi:hypothetical protein